MIRLGAPAVPALIVAIIAGAPVSAHELGPTQVLVTLENSAQYEIRLVTDPAALLDRLALLSGSPSSGSQDDRLAMLLPTLLSHVEIAFDGAQVRPEIAPRFFVDGSQTSLMFRGKIPRGSRSFTWRSSLLYSGYPLLVQTGRSSDPAVQWLQARQQSAPVSVPAAPDHTPRRLPGLPEGAAHVGLVLALLWIVPRQLGTSGSPDGYS